MLSGRHGVAPRAATGVVRRPVRDIQSVRDHVDGPATNKRFDPVSAQRAIGETGQLPRSTRIVVEHDGQLAADQPTRRRAFVQYDRQHRYGSLQAYRCGGIGPRVLRGYHQVTAAAARASSSWQVSDTAGTSALNFYIFHVIEQMYFQDLYYLDKYSFNGANINVLLLNVDLRLTVAVRDKQRPLFAFVIYMAIRRDASSRKRLNHRTTYASFWRV